MGTNQKQTEKSTCILCGEKIEHLEQPVEIRCDFCGKIAISNNQCEHSHYICEDCDSIPINNFIKSICYKYKGIDPIALAVEIMNSPQVRMHGPEHHFIVPAVLITCVNNLAGRSLEELQKKLDIAEIRSISETPDHCQYALGSCGAAMGTGVFLSIYTNRTPETEDEWSLMNSIIAKCQKNIADAGGPRCCKRDTYISLETAVDFLKERFSIELEKSQGKCTFSLRNPTCKHEDCTFYNLSNSLV